MVNLLARLGIRKILLLHLLLMLSLILLCIYLAITSSTQVSFSEFDVLLKNNFIFISILAFSFSCLLSFVLLVNLEPRIQKLREAALYIASGNFDFKINDDMGDSLAEVSTAFDQMSTDLSKLNEELDLRHAQVDGIDFRRKITLAAARIVEWEYDPKTHNFALNKLWRSELGLPTYGLVEEGFLGQLVSEDRKQLLALLSGFKEGGEELIEFPVRLLSTHDTDEQAWILVRGQLIDYEREIIGGVLLDISEQKDLEEQLAQVNKLESIGQLASGIAHEINTPMQYIGDNLEYIRKTNLKLNGYAESCEKALKGELGSDLGVVLGQLEEEKSKLKVVKLKERSQEAVSDAIEGVRSVAKIVKAMKDYSHPDKEEKTLCDLNHIVLTAIAVSRNEWKHFAKIEENLSDNLPPIPAYMGELNQVVLNIIVNASHAIAKELAAGDRQNKEPAKIVVETHENTENESLEIIITDNGPGMSDEVKDKIFDQFYTTKDVGKGTGLGLSICYSIITARHEGDIRVDTKLGKGTKFLVSLPKERKGLD